MAFEYGINAKLNVDSAIKNVEKLVTALEKAEQKASNLKVTVNVNNKLVEQLGVLKQVSAAKKSDTQETAKQAAAEERLAALKAKTAAQEQKNAAAAKSAEEDLALKKQRTAAQAQKNAQDAAAAEQRLAAQKKTDADADLARAQKLRTEEQKTAEAAQRAEQVKQKSADAAAKAAQDRQNAQRKADDEATAAAVKIAEAAARGQERVRQEQERTTQSQINSYTAILRLIDQADRTKYNSEQRARREAEATARAQERAQRAEKENADAIARDLEKQARIEQAQAEIEEQKVAKNKELRTAIEANQKAQAEYNRVLAKALPTVNEIRHAMMNLYGSQEALKQAQYRANSPLSGLIGKVGPEGTWGKTLQSIGGWVSKAGESLQGITQAFTALQQPAENMFSSILNTAKGFFNTAINGFANLTQEGLGAFGTLEMAEIGFANFFNGSATEFTRRIKETAVGMPMVGAADLARSVQYIAPLAGGSSDLALSAVEGVMKAIVYSGNDVSQYGTKALQNLTQVVSGNLTATDIKEMMRQMPALPRLLASTETGKELLQNGQITTSAVKNYIAKYGSEAILGVFKEISEKSEASDIYEQANKTFKGAMEQLQEKMVLSWQDVFEQSGMSDLVRDLLNDLARDGGVIDQFANSLQHVGQVVVEWIKANQDNIKELLDAVMTALTEVGKTVKGVVTEVLQVLEIVDGTGKLNVSKLKEIIGQVKDFLQGLAKGFGSGLKQVLGVIDAIRKRLGDDTFKKLGEMIGWLASPMAKLISALGMMGSNALRAAGGLTTLASGIFKWGGFDNLITEAGAEASKMGAWLEKTSKGRITQAGFTAGVGKVGSGLSKVGSVVGKGVKAASFVALGVAADQAVDSLMELGNVDEGVQKAVSGLTGGITGAAAGFQVFGLKGALIGSVIGAITGFVAEVNEQKRQLQEQKNARSDARSEVVLNEGQKQIRDYVLESLKTAGYEVDLESKSGRYANDMLEKYIEEQTVTRDENGKITKVDLGALWGKGQEMADLVAGWDRTKQAQERLAAFTDTTQFTSKSKDHGGKVIDFKQDKAARDWVADFVERNILNGDEYAYDYTRPNEEIVEDYLDGYQLTYDQLDLLKAEEENVYEELKAQTTDFSTSLSEIDSGIKKITEEKGDLAKLANYTEDLHALLVEMNQHLIDIANEEGSDSSVYVTSGMPGAKFADDEARVNYEKWSSAVYNPNANDSAKATRKAIQYNSSTKAHMTDQEFYKWYNAPVKNYNRDTMAEYFGKEVGNNDDYMETYDKIHNAYSNLLKERDKHKEGTAEWDDLTQKMTEFSYYTGWLNSIEPGDWFSLFILQREAQKALGKYGVEFRAAGGIIERLFAGRGRGVDTIPAFLQPGEFVMRRAAVDKAGPGVFAALNRGDFAGAAHALGNKFNSSWDNSHHWSNTVNNNNTNNTSNYFFAGGMARGRRNPYRAMANRVATV